MGVQFVLYTDMTNGIAREYDNYKTVGTIGIIKV